MPKLRHRHPSPLSRYDGTGLPVRHSPALQDDGETLAPMMIFEFHIIFQSRTAGRGGDGLQPFVRHLKTMTGSLFSMFEEASSNKSNYGPDYSSRWNCDKTENPQSPGRCWISTPRNIKVSIDHWRKKTRETPEHCPKKFKHIFCVDQKVSERQGGYCSKQHRNSKGAQHSKTNHYPKQPDSKNKRVFP